MNLFGTKSEDEQEQDKGFFTRLKDGLKKTRAGFVNRVSNLFSGYSDINDELFEELEELLI